MTFVLNENGDWINTDAKFGELGTIFAIKIKKVVSRFNRHLPPKYFVVLDQINERSYRAEAVASDSFYSLDDAKNFAAKLASWLTREDN